MAIASVGSLGIGAGSGAGTTVAFAPTAQLDANNIGLLVFVTDNLGTTDAESSEHTSVVDSVGNSWTKLGEYRNGNGTAQTGVTTSVWYTKATTNLTTGGTITCTVSTSGYDRCASAWEFSGARLVKGAANVNNAIDAANGFGSVAFSGLGSKSRLYFRGLGKEANSTTVLTPSASFTVITPQRSRNNALATLVRGEFRINTSTGETSNPTLAVSGDTAGIFLALEEGFTGSAVLTTGVVTLSGSATRTNPTYTGTSALTIGGVTLSGSATVVNPLYTGISTLTVGASTLVGSATYTGPALYTGTSALTVGAVAFSSTGEVTAEHPVVQITQTRYGIWGQRYLDFSGKPQTPPFAQGSIAVTIGAVTLTGAVITGAAHPVVRITQFRYGLTGRRYGDFSNKGTGTFSGVATLTTGAVTLSSSATTTTPTYTGTSALTASRATLSGSAIFTDPFYTGTASLVIGRATIASTGSVVNPTWTGGSGLTAPGATLSGTAIYDASSSQGTSALIAPRTTLSGSSTFLITYTASAALTTSRATITAAGSVTNATYAASAVLTIGSITFASAALTNTIPGPYYVDARMLYTPGGVAGSIYLPGVSAWGTVQV